MLDAEVSFARHLGMVGNVFPIVETDALAEIREAAVQVDWGKAIDQQKKLAMIKNFRPGDLNHLPAAKSNRSFMVDMTYTLDINIPDGKGGVLFPKGFTFNPRDYVRLTSILVVIDADDRRQVDWFKTAPYARDYRTG
ncbi:MAG: hypothetical protein KKC76_21170 [Proteobacteria bacterium]|nr:hypothetical protein [Pseudomonadota bacterium]MBU4295150.1 hypothetical protein [Pseudomonadota bacterium]MCG2747014.1 hypothetical protein [Desulfobulbaceae bacterium]